MPNLNGHDPEADFCPPCGQRCAHAELFVKQTKRRGPGKILDGKKFRVVTYMKMHPYFRLLKIAGGRDISDVVRELLDTHPRMIELEEKEIK